MFNYYVIQFYYIDSLFLLNSPDEDTKTTKQSKQSKSHSNWPFDIYQDSKKSASLVSNGPRQLHPPPHRPWRWRNRDQTWTSWPDPSSNLVEAVEKLGRFGANPVPVRTDRENRDKEPEKKTSLASFLHLFSPNEPVHQSKAISGNDLSWRYLPYGSIYKCYVSRDTPWSQPTNVVGEVVDTWGMTKHSRV